MAAASLAATHSLFPHQKLIALGPAAFDFPEPATDVKASNFGLK
jgi:hypothetical protein